MKTTCMVHATNSITILTQLVQLSRCHLGLGHNFFKPVIEISELVLLLTVLKCQILPSTILNNKEKLYSLLTYLYH